VKQRYTVTAVTASYQAQRTADLSTEL